jgi:hypothetical protein
VASPQCPLNRGKPAANVCTNAVWLLCWQGLLPKHLYSSAAWFLLHAPAMLHAVMLQRPCHTQYAGTAAVSPVKAPPVSVSILSASSPMLSAPCSSPDLGASAGQK